jgi:outer membrane protein TolC
MRTSMRINSCYFRSIISLILLLAWTRPSAAQNLPKVEPAKPPSPARADCLAPSSDSLQRPAQPQEVEIKTVCPLTLEQAVASALQSNPTLRGQILTLEKSKAALRQANAALYPTVTLQGGPTLEENFDLSDPEAVDTTSYTSQTLSGEASVSYNVYTSGQRSANIQAAKQQVRYDDLGIRALTEQTRLDVATDYYDLQNADAQVPIQKAAVANAQESLRTAEVREQAGIGTPL